MTPVAYLDTSALVKLVIAEPESMALQTALRRWPRRVSSEIAVAELLRAVCRREPALQSNALAVLSGVALHKLDHRTLMKAALLQPSSLRTLDAIHLACAMELASAISVFVAYDATLQTAAQRAEFIVEAPA